MVSPMVWSMSGPNPTFLARLSRQHGTAGRWQALRDGHTKGEFDQMVRSGLLERDHHGIYHVAGAAPTPEQRAMAAVLRCRPRASVSGRFVLGLFGIEGFTRFDPFVVLVPPERTVSNVDFPVLADRCFDSDRATMDGIPIVTIGRALFDAATDLGDRAVLTAIDSGKWSGLLDDRKLDALLDRCAWHPQAGRIQRLVDEGLTEQESHGERGLARVFDGFEPEPEYQVWITPSIRVDGLWRDAWMALEYLGVKDHGAGWRRERDAARDAVIRSHGYHVEYVTKEDLAQPLATRARLVAVREALLAQRRLLDGAG